MFPYGDCDEGAICPPAVLVALTSDCIGALGSEEVAITSTIVIIAKYLPPLGLGNADSYQINATKPKRPLEGQWEERGGARRFCQTGSPDVILSNTNYVKVL